MKKALWITVGTILLLVAIWVLTPLPLVLSGTDLKMHRHFMAIGIGDDQQTTLQLLGPPIYTEQGLLYPLRGLGIRRIIGEIKSATSYSVWYNGANIVYVVGYDQKKKVVVTICGST